LFLDFSRKISLKGLHEMAWNGMSSGFSLTENRIELHERIDMFFLTSVTFSK
jgi:hypothetical protein